MAKMDKTRAILFIADGFEEIEAVTVMDILRRAEIKTELVSVMGRIEAIGGHGMRLLCDSELKEAEQAVKSAEALIFPGGGTGTENLKKHPLLGSIIKEANSSGKLLAAICAAPAVLGKYGVLEGHEAVCYPGGENELKGASVSSENICLSGNILTAKAAGAASEFAFKIVELLMDKSGLDGKKNAKRIKGAMFYS